jgi:hypothetical protein
MFGEAISWPTATGVEILGEAMLGEAVVFGNVTMFGDVAIFGEVAMLGEAIFGEPAMACVVGDAIFGDTGIFSAPLIGAVD